MLLAGGLLSLVSGTVGYLLASSSAPLPAGAAPAPTQLDLEPVLAELRRTREGFLDAVRSGRGADPPGPVEKPADDSREPAIPEDRLDRFQATLDDIVSRLERARLEERGRGYSDLGAIQGRAQLFVQGLEPAAVIRDELSAAHAHWTRRDLIDRYGPPHSFEASEKNVIGHYDLGAAWVRFVLFQDQVVEVSFVSK